MALYRGFALALCCCILGLVLTGTVHGSRRGFWDDYNWGAYYTTTESYPEYTTNETRTTPRVFTANQKLPPPATYKPTVWVYKPTTGKTDYYDFRIATVTMNKTYLPTDQQTPALNKPHMPIGKVPENVEDSAKLRVETSGDSGPQEAHFALSLVPLLRAWAPLARLDAESDILRYFRKHRREEQPSDNWQ